jgi:signal transduction histidine kinase
VDLLPLVNLRRWDALITTGGLVFRSAPVSLYTVMRRAAEGTAEFAESREVRLTRVTADLGLVLADENLLVRALQALLGTAVKFSEKGGTIRLSGDVGPVPSQIRVRRFVKRWRCVSGGFSSEAALSQF